MSTMLLISIVLLLSVVLLFLQNTASIAVDFLIFHFDMPISVLILMSVIIGIVVAMGLFSVLQAKYERKIRAKNKKINKLKKEISKLNNEKFGENVNLDNQTSDLYNIFLKTLKDDDRFEVEYVGNVQDLKEKDSIEDKPKLEQEVKKEEPKKKYEKEKKILSGFDDVSDDTFSIKCKKEKKEEKSVPWFSPNFKNNKTMEVVKKEEKKDNLDELIRFDIDLNPKEEKTILVAQIPQEDTVEDICNTIETQELQVIKETNDIASSNETQKKQEPLHIEGKNIIQDLTDEIKDDNVTEDEDDIVDISETIQTEKIKYTEVEDVSITNKDNSNKNKKRKKHYKKEAVFDRGDLDVFDDYGTSNETTMKLEADIQKDDNVLRDMYLIDEYKKNVSENVLSVNDIRQKFNWASEEKEDYGKYVVETKKRIRNLFSIDKDLRK